MQKINSKFLDLDENIIKNKLSNNKINTILNTNNSINFLMFESFVKSRVIFLRHLDYNKEEWNKWSLTKEWKIKANEIAEKISWYIWKNTNWYELNYADDTYRVIETAWLLQEKIAFDAKFHKIHWLKTREKSWKTNIATSLSKISPNTISFLNNLLEANKDAVCIIHRTNAGAIFDYLNNNEWDRILEYSKLEEWDTFIVDIDVNWNIIQYEQNKLLHIIPDNLDEIVSILEKDNIFSDVIREYKLKNIDSKYLQNTINYYFNKYNLYEKYLFSNSIELSDYCLENLTLNEKELDNVLFYRINNFSFNDLSFFFKQLSRFNYTKQAFKTLKEFSFYNFTNKEFENIYLMYYLLKTKVEIDIFSAYKKVVSLNNKQKETLLKKTEKKLNYKEKIWEKFKKIDKKRKSIVNFSDNAKKYKNLLILDEINNNIIESLNNIINWISKELPYLKEYFYTYLENYNDPSYLANIFKIKKTDFYKSNKKKILELFKLIDNLKIDNIEIFNLTKWIRSVLFENLDNNKSLNKEWIKFTKEGVIWKNNYKQALVVAYRELISSDVKIKSWENIIETIYTKMNFDTKILSLKEFKIEIFKKRTHIFFTDMFLEQNIVYVDSYKLINKYNAKTEKEMIGIAYNAVNIESMIRYIEKKLKVNEFEVIEIFEAACKYAFTLLNKKDENLG